MLPLVEEGVIQRLTLVDAQIDDSVNTLRSQLIRTLSSGDQRKVQNRKQPIIGYGTQLPDAQQVTFLESGLTLPEAHRVRDEECPEYDDSPEIDFVMAPFIRSSQIGPTTVHSGNILAALSGSTSRTLHVFDTAFVLRPLSESDHRAYVESFLSSVPGWRIQKWSSLETEAPVRYGVLQYRS